MAARLRMSGHRGAITVIGQEPIGPYQRPPLSKAYLLGDMGVERLMLRAEEWWHDNDIRLLSGCRVTSVDRLEKTLATDVGDIAYDQLALTTGASPRRFPAEAGGLLSGVFTIRNLADIDLLRPELMAGRHMVVIGGGYIGLEAASVARKLGLAVTLIEASAGILGRVAAPATAGLIRALHLSHGVNIIENTGISGLIGDKRVCGARLADGTEIAADLVVLGIGVTPDTALAETAGLIIDNGIACDGHGRTSDRNIWAAGDCASFPAPAGASARLRLESVGNAIDSAEIVADNMLGAGRLYMPKPWFWSDQYDAKLQIAGLGTGYDRIVTRKGDQTHGGSVWYFAGDRLIAVDALDDARAYMVGKRLIEAGRTADPAAIADPSVALKSLL